MFNPRIGSESTTEEVTFVHVLDDDSVQIDEEGICNAEEATLEFVAVDVDCYMHILLLTLAEVSSNSFFTVVLEWLILIIINCSSTCALNSLVVAELLNE